MKYLNLFESWYNAMKMINQDIFPDIESLITDCEEDLNVNIIRQFYTSHKYWSDCQSFIDIHSESISLSFRYSHEQLNNVYEFCQRIVSFCNSNDIGYVFHIRKILNNISQTKSIEADELETLKEYLDLGDKLEICIYK